METKKRFNRQEREIIRTLYSERRPMSLRELAKDSSMSWITAHKYTEKLNKRGLVNFVSDNKQKKIRFRFDIF